MNKIELKEILMLHKKWLDGDEDGVRANLWGANLQEANLQEAKLQGANLWGAKLQGANLQRANLQEANLREANLWGANLREANLWGANLQEANLQEANLDFSCLPLKCGGLRWKIHKRIACQLAYHLCSMQCDDAEYIKMRNSILWFANQFHRTDECGELEEISVESEKERDML